MPICLLQNLVPRSSKQEDPYRGVFSRVSYPLVQKKFENQVFSTVFTLFRPGAARLLVSSRGPTCSCAQVTLKRNGLFFFEEERQHRFYSTRSSELLFDPVVRSEQSKSTTREQPPAPAPALEWERRLWPQRVREGSSGGTTYRLLYLTAWSARSTRGQVTRFKQPLFSGARKPQGARLGVAPPNLFCLISLKRTKNNTHAIISNLFGENKTLWSISAGQFKLPGGRRKTRLSQRMVYKSCLEKALSFGYKYTVIHCRGTRGSKVRIFRFFGEALSVLLVKDTTATAHNGCRPPKMRRV